MNVGLNANHIAFLLQGAAWTVGLSLMAFIGGGTLGFLVALSRISPVRALRVLSGVYVQLIQGTPLLVLMFLVYFGLPAIGIKISPLLAAGACLIALSNI